MMSEQNVLMTNFGPIPVYGVQVYGAQDGVFDNISEVANK